MKPKSARSSTGHGTGTLMARTISKPRRLKLGGAVLSSKDRRVQHDNRLRAAGRLD